MNPEQKKIIVIPVYKQLLNKSEVQSLQQCFKILNEFPVCFICGASFSFKDYLHLIPANINYKICRFRDEYFSSLDGYNRLLLSLDFYKSFRQYQYMLIYQLDAWVFKNELNYWCAKGYSYIGAPWFNGWSKATTDSYFIGVGNGGFSLRNIRRHIEVLQVYKNKILPKHYVSLFFKKPSLRGIKQLAKNLLFNCTPYHKYHPANEDIFWGRIAPRICKSFTIPDMKTALQFSVEANPSIYADLAAPPFGCHAWEKLEPEFWKKIIN